MGKKNIWKFYPILIFIFIIVFFEIKQYRERTQFFETKLNAIIIDTRGNWTGGRSFNYVTREKVILTLVNNEITNFRIGDSIVKKDHSWDFKVYRIPANGLEYKFLNRYNFIEANK